MQFLKQLNAELTSILTEPAEKKTFTDALMKWESRCGRLWFPSLLDDIGGKPETVPLEDWLKAYFRATAKLASGEVLAWRAHRDVTTELKLPRRPWQPGSETPVVKRMDQLDALHDLLKPTPFYINFTTKTTKTTKTYPDNQIKQKHATSVASVYALMRFGLQYLPDHAYLIEQPDVMAAMKDAVVSMDVVKMTAFLHPRVIGALLHKKAIANINYDRLSQLIDVIKRKNIADDLPESQSLGAAVMRKLSGAYAGGDLDIAVGVVGLPEFLDALLAPLMRREPADYDDLLYFKLFADK